MTSTDDLSSSNTITVEEARTNLRESIQQCGSWDNDCEQAAIELVKAMISEGSDQVEISKELQGVGLSKSGAAELIYEVVSGNSLAQTHKEIDKARYNSPMSLIWGIFIVIAMPVGMIVMAVKGVPIQAYHWLVGGILFVGGAFSIVKYILSKWQAE